MQVLHGDKGEVAAQAYGGARRIKIAHASLKPEPGFDFRPTKKMRAYLVLSDLSLASRYDSLYDTTGAVLVKVPSRALSKDIGKEADVYGTYDVNSRLQLGAGLGHLYAGQFLKQASPGGNSSYPYVFMDYHF